MSEPVGRPQGGFKSEAGKAAYWRLNYESAIGALADLIAEHTETVEAQKQVRADLRDRVESLVEYGCPEWSVEEGDDLGRHLRKDQVLALIDGGES